MQGSRRLTGHAAGSNVLVTGIPDLPSRASGSKLRDQRTNLRSEAMPHAIPQTTISASDLARAPARSMRVIDVRKPVARLASGQAIAGAVWRHPFDAMNWAGEFKGHRVAVYCVHGHEVSRAVRGYLADEGIEAVLVEGGFEAWVAAGLPVDRIGAGDA